MSGPRILRAQPLTRDAFAPFGDVIALEGARHFPINGGTTERFHDLATIDVCADGGRPLVSVFRAQPRALPVALTLMERHPHGSQAFIPLAAVARYAIVVAPAGDFRPDAMRAFVAEGWQGVNYAKGVWHHPLLALDAVSDFVIVDRGGPQPNCDEIALADPWVVELGLGPAGAGAA
ncbi:ureidoglycolate lyase [Burkholderia vietnamiensis]|uniref:ureidoglycolate lyase n=1 Tax=Burkholderia vietnamiensis TaxID=60552 RepID=UPI000757E9DC|nr:ureidoglycolate lyase [Burkholderia vietnamiensis]KVE95302.1 ureidoglycolate hydrolase [Burkholderia vietnamiensis]MBR7918180.1 ureidoglycolate lyase [Burkholderia vietnamiensis]